MPHLVAAVVLEVCAQGTKVFGKTLVICRTGDEGDVVFGDVGGGGAGWVEETGADAVAEAVESSFFEGHVPGCEGDVGVVARAQGGGFVFVGLIGGEVC